MTDGARQLCVKGHLEIYTLWPLQSKRLESGILHVTRQHVTSDSTSQCNTSTSWPLLATVWQLITIVHRQYSRASLYLTLYYICALLKHFLFLIIYSKISVGLYRSMVLKTCYCKFPDHNQFKHIQTLLCSA